jgi:dihydrofolate synthase/folylpolyglutamate synthase
MDYKNCLEKLESIQDRKYNLDLKNITNLLKKLGDPHKKIRCIHIAGTNGKGSVATMIASILKASGYKTGLYMSPHLKKVNERIKIDNDDIPDEDFAKYFTKVWDNQDNETYFELLTATAFLYFHEKDVDFLVLEVGLGGRLDATNVVDPLVSVITNISLEHTKYLGETKDKIAMEKAGIIKKGRPVVTATQGIAFAVISDLAKKVGSKLTIVKDYSKNNGTFNINEYKNLYLKIKGEFQLLNAATAVTAIDTIKDEFKIEKKHIEIGLKDAFIPGRFQFIEEKVLVDCAHNPTGAMTLRKEIEKLDRKNVISVVGILKDKDSKSMIDEISRFSKKIIFCRPNSSRANDPKELCRLTEKECSIVLDPKSALEKAKNEKHDLIVVTGSFYTVGEVI